MLVLMPVNAASPRAVEGWLRSNSDGWVRCNPGHYMMMSRHRAETLSADLEDHLGSGIQHLIAEVDLDNIQGLMAAEVWHWVNLHR